MPTRRPAGEYGGILLPLFMGTRHFFPFRGNTIDRNAVRYWRPGELAWPSKRPRKQKILRERDALLLRFPGMCTRLLETMQLTGRDNQEHPFSLEKKRGKRETSAEMRIIEKVHSCTHNRASLDRSRHCDRKSPRDRVWVCLSPRHGEEGRHSSTHPLKKVPGPCRIKPASPSGLRLDVT